MLVLTRKVDEIIVIGDNIKIKVLETSGSRVRLGIDAPPEIDVRRPEAANKKGPPRATDSNSQGSSTSKKFGKKRHHRQNQRRAS